MRPLRSGGAEDGSALCSLWFRRIYVPSFSALGPFFLEGNREGVSGALIPRPEELAVDLVGYFGRLDKREYEQQNEVLGVLQSRTSVGVVDVGLIVGHCDTIFAAEDLSPVRNEPRYR